MSNCDPALISSTPGTPAAYARDLTMRLSHAFQDAAHTSATSKLHQKHQYDKKVVFHPHKAGDVVLLDDPAHRTHKLAPRWKRPFVVLRGMSRDGSPGVTYEIVDPRNEHSRQWIVHHNKLKAYRTCADLTCPRPCAPCADWSWYSSDTSPSDCLVSGPVLSSS